MDQKNILIYRDNLLPPSETFIQQQSKFLRDYNAYYVGAKRVKGFNLPKEKVVTAAIETRGLNKISESLYKLWHIAPGFLKKLEKIQPRLIHAHFGPDGARALHLKKRLGIPLIVTFHGFDITVKDQYALKANYSHRKFIGQRSELLNNGDLFIAVSKFIEAKLIEKGFPEEKVVQHYIGIDTKKFTAEPEIDRENIVLFVGRLTEKKGCRYLIKAMREVQKNDAETELVILGDGKLRNSLEEMAKELGVRVQFLGFQPPEIVKLWMNKAKVLCVPSIIAENGDTEAFGMVFAEAQSMGTPVVSFSTGGIPEVVEHEKTGFLASPRDEKKLCSYILTLLHDDKLWILFSKRAVKNVHKKFNIETQTRKLENIYFNLIKNNLG